MRRNLILVVLLSLVTIQSSVAFSETPIIGRATVIDGDTIEIHGERIRLNGIDAPESAQLCDNAQGKPYRCGAVAAKALDKFLAASNPTRCKFVDRDRYGRFVGDCYRQDDSNVAIYLVRSGFALDWPRYSKGEYADEQEEAKAERLGLWAGVFIPPWEWRANRRKRPTKHAVIRSPVRNDRASFSRGFKFHGALGGAGDRSCFLHDWDPYGTPRQYVAQLWRY